MASSRLVWRLRDSVNASTEGDIDEDMAEPLRLDGVDRETVDITQYQANAYNFSDS